MTAPIAMTKKPLLGSGKLLAFVLPAPKGCNLDCSFCHIKGREEAKENNLSGDDYLSFFDKFKSVYDVDLLAIQGYEPLLDETWSTTKQLLAEAKQAGIPFTLVTNGWNLAKYAHELKDADTIYVSLDAANAEGHDATRRTKGAFEQALSGIQRCVELGMSDQVAVASVLQPNRSELLTEMPELLKKNGISLWVVNPLHNVGNKNFGDIVAPMSATQGIQLLSRISKRTGVEMVVDDELHHHTFLNSLSDITVRRLESPQNTIRLSPNGQLSIGRDIATKAYTAIWDSSKHIEELPV